MLFEQNLDLKNQMIDNIEVLMVIELNFLYLMDIY